MNGNDDSRPMPFQFSLAALMMIVAVYAVLFGALRSLHVSVAAFVMVTLYFTTVVYGRWMFFGGRYPYYAAFFTGGILFALGAAAEFVATNGEGFKFLLWIYGPAVGGFVGVGAAGIVDIGMIAVELLNHTYPKHSPDEDWHPRHGIASVPTGGTRSYRRLRLAVFVLLLGLFFLGMLWGSVTNHVWIFRSFREPDRIWRIPLDPTSNASAARRHLHGAVVVH